MNTEFYNSHIDTVIKLQSIAKKHNCEIHFGTKNSTEHTDNGIVELGIKDSILKSLTCFNLDNVVQTHSSIWFELYEKKENQSGVYHSLTYYCNSLYFELECDEDDEEMTTELYDWLEENDNGYDDNIMTIYYSNAPTVMYGFGKGKITDYRVYRSGMALKFFADLVCEYLKEPYIKNVY